MVGFLLIMRVDLWEPSMLTLAQVIASTVVALLGVPLGILAAQYKTVETIIRPVIRPVLDFMQTMPAFVYLVPAIVLLGLCSGPDRGSRLCHATGG